MDQINQISGALLVLLGYVLGQMGRIDSSSRSYLVINAIGSALLATAAVSAGQWGFFLLNGIWALISFVNLIRNVTHQSAESTPGA